MTKVELGQLYEKHRDSLLSSAMFHLKGDRDWAEDILHDSFEYMLMNRGLYDPAKGKPLTWMALVVNRRCLNALRDRKTEATQDSTGYFSGVSPSPEDELIEEDEAVRDARMAESLEGWLSEPDPEVPDNIRHAILAHFVSGRSWEDIRQELGVSRFVVYREVQKALDTYRRRFKHESFK